MVCCSWLEQLLLGCYHTPEGGEGKFLQPECCKVGEHTILDCICSQRSTPAKANHDKQLYDNVKLSKFLLLPPLL
jgi:hypothetical protein